MQETLKNLLHTSVFEKDLTCLDKIPLFLTASYEIKLFSISGIDVLFIKPKQQITFAALKKQWAKFVFLTGMQCVVYGDEYTRYGRERMIELGIPFFYGKDNMYLPFLGVALGKKKVAQLPNPEKFSPITQKMVLLAIYKKWEKISTKEISEIMEVSRITAARALTELQALNLPLVVLEGKTKYFNFLGNKRDLYQMCQEYFINPVAKKIPLTEIPTGIHCRSGYSALADCSMLADNDYPTYGVTRQEYHDLGIDEYSFQPVTDKPVCIVQILRYIIEQDGHIDPISAFLSLPDDEKNEPRTESAVDEILEDILND